MMTDEVTYADLSDLPPATAPKKPRRKKLAALFVVTLFVAGAVAFYLYGGGKPSVDSNADELRKQMTEELHKLHAPIAVVLLATGGALLLAGRRLYAVAFFLAGFLAGGFLGYTVWTSAAATLTCISAATKMYMAVGLSVVCGGVLGTALSRLERFGTAAIAACAGFAGGCLLYPITLDHWVTAWWGQYVCGGICALVAFVIVFALEKQLLVTTTAAAGAFAAATGGAQLFFQYDPTSADFQKHWNDAAAGDVHIDDHFWTFLGSVVGLFVLGLLVQLKLDPYIAGKRAAQNKQDLSFYNDEEQQQTQPEVVQTSTTVRYF